MSFDYTKNFWQLSFSNHFSKYFYKSAIFNFGVINSFKYEIFLLERFLFQFSMTSKVIANISQIIVFNFM